MSVTVCSTCENIKSGKTGGYGEGRYKESERTV